MLLGCVRLKSGLVLACVLELQSKKRSEVREMRMGSWARKPFAVAILKPNLERATGQHGQVQRTIWKEHGLGQGFPGLLLSTAWLKSSLGFEELSVLIP